MNKHLLLDQLRDRYDANPEESLELLLDFLQNAFANGEEAIFKEPLIQLLALVPEASQGLFDDDDIILSVEDA